jgi:protein-S-isoprenylcysteine O-methyltransferase Ste14
MVRTELPVWLRVIGAMILVGGAALVNGGIRALGRHATPFPEPTRDGVLIVRGVYGLVRHPIYGGLALFCIGLGLAWPSWWAVGLGLGLLAFFRFKAWSEEQRLLAVYPNYVRYRTEVRATLVPYLI